MERAGRDPQLISAMEHVYADRELARPGRFCSGRRRPATSCIVTDGASVGGEEPRLFYYWQRQLFENAGTTLGTPRRGHRAASASSKPTSAQLEAKLAKKDAVNPGGDLSGATS